MSDWSKQTTELVNTWSETQKKLWDSWRSTVEAMTGQEAVKGFESERQKAVEAWEASIRKGLAAQSEWAKLWLEGLSSDKGTPKPVVEWAKQLQEMMQSWASSQEQFAKVWFEMMKKMGGGELGEAWEAQGKALVRAWQEAVDKALEAQREMGKVAAKARKQA